MEDHQVRRRDDEVILIGTSSVEEHSHGRVAQRLEALGHRVVVYRTDRVLSGQDSFFVEVDENASVRAMYAGVDISPDCVSAAWYWKLTSFRAPGAESNVSRQLTLVNEVTQLNNALWSVYSDEVWLSSPASLWRAERKLAQLQIASSVGFDVPLTIMGSDWDRIEQQVFSRSDKLAIKMSRGVIADQNSVRSMNTTVLDAESAQNVRSKANSFPGIHQPFVPKAREWRVTVVGDDVFAAAIYTSDAAKDDWRRHQMGPDVRFAADSLPAGIEQKCIDYLRAAQLGYGAFDFIETPDGRVVFLECNPSGQFSWLEDQLGLPISQSIADSLSRLSKHGPRLT